MFPGEFYTWSRALSINVMDGRLPTEELTNRTLGFTLIDNVKGYDTIEWRLDNSDGMLTRPEYIPLGLLVAVQLGYEGTPTQWRAFIINRVQGGVGVWGRPRAAVGDNDATITFYGRNRNAPGGRTGHSIRTKIATPPKKRQKTFAPTLSDASVQEMLLEQKATEGFIPGKTTSDVVRKIAAAHGFIGDHAYIEDTKDQIDGVALVEGIPDGALLEFLASNHGYIFKICGEDLYWHSPHWQMAVHAFADVLDYSTGSDLLRVSLDCDFQLPVPANLKGKSYNPERRAWIIVDLERNAAEGKANMHLGAFEGLITDKSRANLLTHDQTIPIHANTELKAEARVLQNFVKKHARAFKLVIETVGNPKLLATKLVQVKGLGTPLVDGTWYIAQARHMLDGTTYRTEVTLTQPPKNKAVPNNRTMGVIVNRERDAAEGKLRAHQMVHVGLRIPKTVRSTDLR